MPIHAVYVLLVSQEIPVQFVLLDTALRHATSAALDTTQVEEEPALHAVQLFLNATSVHRILSAQYVQLVTKETSVKYVLQLIINRVIRLSLALHASVLSLTAVSAQTMLLAANAWSVLLDLHVPLVILDMLLLTATLALWGSIKLP